MNLKKLTAIIFAFLLVAGIGAGFSVKTYAAAGVSISPSSDTVYVGDSVTVTVTLYGDDIYAYSGYISCDGNLSGASEGFVGDDNGVPSVSFSYTYYAVGEGTASIYVSGCEVSDGSSKEYAGDAACTINVIGYDNGGGGTGGNAGGDNSGDNGGNNSSDETPPINGNEVKEGSDNTNLSVLSVEGYELEDEGHDIFSVSVSGSINYINIIAYAEDENAVVYGAGEQELEEGENYFDITVVAENGYTRVYTINVLRRGNKIVLTELMQELSETQEDTIIVSLKENDKLTKEMIDAISKWGKKICLNRYDTDGKLLYGWTFDGKAIAEAKDFKEFDPKVTFESNQIKKINELSNNAPGKILNFAYSGELPDKTTFTIPIGKDFSKGDTLFLYYYDEKDNTLKREGREIDVTGELITMDLSHCSQFFLTSTFLTIKTEEKEEKSNSSLIIIVIIAAVVIAALVAAFLLLRKKKQEQEETAALENIARIFEENEDFDEEEEYETADFDRRPKK